MLKYVQKLRINCERKVNCIVDHAANFKQQIVSCRLKCWNSERNCLSICCLSKPLNVRSKQNKRKGEMTKQQTFYRLLQFKTYYYIAVEIGKIRGGRHRGVNVGGKSEQFGKCLLIKTIYKYVRRYEKTVASKTVSGI